jgi:hypothetical protein
MLSNWLKKFLYFVYAQAVYAQAVYAQAVYAQADKSTNNVKHYKMLTSFIILVVAVMKQI